MSWDDASFRHTEENLQLFYVVYKQCFSYRRHVLSELHSWSKIGYETMVS